MTYTVTYDGQTRYAGTSREIAEGVYARLEFQAMTAGVHLVMLCNGDVLQELEA